MNKKKISIGLNLLIIVIEIIGFVLCYRELGINSFIYYTLLSNLFLLVASILYLFKNIIKSRIVDIIKFGSTLSVLITFLVVIFVLGPNKELTYHFLLFEGANFYYHLVCPVLGIITFLFFDDVRISGFRDVLGAFTFTVLYSIVIISLNILKVIVGPYPFLRIYENPIYATLIWIVVLEGGAILLGMGLEKLKNII